VLLEAVKRVRASWTARVALGAVDAAANDESEPRAGDAWGPVDELTYMPPRPRFAAAKVSSTGDPIAIDGEYIMGLHDKSHWPAESWPQVQTFATYLEGGNLHEDVGRFVIVSNGSVSIGFATEKEAAETADAFEVQAGLIMRVGRDS
jgi:hypothetical protein